jgi:lipopolysaccharide export LptBFGC system permease protein LptF
MIKLDKNTKKQLIELYKTKKISLEGNILKLIDPDGDEEFASYIKDSIEKDKDVRRKRLDITKQVQSQNNDLVKWKNENERVNKELTIALEEAKESNEGILVAKQETEDSLEEAQIARVEAESARVEAESARVEAENAKIVAESDLDLIQKKSQFELIGTIVRVALWVILGVGVVTTVMYLIALSMGLDTSVIGSTWSNIIGILLTNAFSIVGTIMGVKYASEKKD